MNNIIEKGISADYIVNSNSYMLVRHFEKRGDVGNIKIGFVGKGIMHRVATELDNYVSVKTVIRQFRSKNYDLICCPRWSGSGFPWTLHIANKLKANLIVAYDKFLSDGLTSKLFSLGSNYRKVESKENPIHEVERSATISEYCFGNIRNKIDSTKIPILLESRSSIHNRYGNLLGNGRMNVIIAPGASWPRRRWPIQSFITLVGQIQKMFHVNIICIGAGPYDNDCGKLIRDNAKDGPVISAINELNISETVELIRASDLVISNDSAAGHIASATDVDSIIISCHPIGGCDDHYNSPVRFRPYNKSIVIQPMNDGGACAKFCASFDPHCIQRITHLSVMKSVAPILDGLSHEK